MRARDPARLEANLEARLEANLEANLEALQALELKAEALKPEAEARGRKLLPNEAREQEENTPRGEQVAPPESVMDLDRLLSALVTCGVRSEAQVDELTDALARGETSEQELIETWGLAVAICGPPPSEPAAVSALESALWHPTCPGAPVRSTRRARVLYLEAAPPLLPSRGLTLTLTLSQTLTLTRCRRRWPSSSSPSTTSSAFAPPSRARYPP